MLKIFIDTANINEIENAFSWGIIDGVTTNPSLIKTAAEKLGRKADENYIREILEAAGKGHPVSLEVIGVSSERMIEQARKLYDKFDSIAHNVVIKIPVNPYYDQLGEIDEFFQINKILHPELEGIKAISQLSKDGIPVNCTLVMNPEQGLLAMKAGAKYVSPFAGRIDDYLRERKLMEPAKKEDYYPAEGKKKQGKEEIVDDEGIVSGVDLVRKIVQIREKGKFESEVIAASVRNPRQVRELALTGVDIITIPFNVLKKMLSHEKTLEGMKKFINDIVPEYREIFK